MSRLSMMAWSSFSSARYVRSITAPLRRFFSLVRTKAPPLPGLTCWNSTTLNSPSGRSRVMPFFRSLVETLIVGARLAGLVLGSETGRPRFQGQAVPVAAEAHDRPGRHRGHDGGVAPRLAPVRIRQVQLDDGPV